jgi:DNA polymerase-1
MLSYLENEGREILARLLKEPTVAIGLDTETTGLKVAGGWNICIGVSIAGLFENGDPFSHYYALTHETGVNVSKKTVALLEKVLTQEGRPLVLCNVQFDILSLETRDIFVENQEFYDISTMACYVNENWPKAKSLNDLSRFYLGEAGKIVDPYVEKEKESGNHNITPEQMFEYAVMDAVSTWRVWDQMMQHPEWLRIPKRLWKDKQKFIRVLLAMRRRGIRIDQPLAQEQVDIGEAELKRLAKELGFPAVPKKPTKMYPNPDPDPLPQLGANALKEIFIDRLGLPPMNSSPKTGKPSFAKDVMEEYDIMLEHLESPEAQLVKEYRGWQKAVSASYKPYLKLVDPDGRLRCSYKTHGTVTMRLSSAEPNLQQIPKLSTNPWNGKVKECFIAEEGYTLVNFDYKQLELRLATFYSGDKALAQVFNEGRDIFEEMSRVLGYTRDLTKRFVYTTQYGGGIPRVMSVFNCNEAEAKKVRANYFATYPLFKMLSDRCSEKVQKFLEIELWSGRYRHFEYRSEGYKAMNSMMQGGGADIMERVMIRCFEELDNDDCRMLLQVHDSLTWEIRTELVDEMMPKIQAMMEDVSTAVGHDEFNVKFGIDADFWSKREMIKYADWKELT